MHYDFPDGGWECNKCTYYNFKGRMKCQRCKKEKSDNHFRGKQDHKFLGMKEKKTLKAAK